MAIGLALPGCSKAVEGGIEGGTTAGASAGEPGGTGGSGVGGGVGGAGGGAGGGSGPDLPCGVDCSAITAPPCFKAVCDVAQKICTTVTTPDGEPCDDGQFCTTGETCNAGACGAGELTTCGIEPATCEQVVCDEDTETCGLALQDDGSACVSEDLCEVNATCTAGVCAGAPRNCSFFPLPDSCKVAACNPATGDCEGFPGNEGAACSDSGDLCRTGKTCQAGFCAGGTAKDCSHLSVGCANGYCDPGTGTCATHTVLPGDACEQGIGACSVGVCTASGLCAPAPQDDGMGCDDGDPCTVGETCLAGACQGGDTSAYSVYFSETFASNAAGWTFVPGVKTDGSSHQLWAIGAAAASTGHTTGNPDPALDFTSTDDNGVAGVVLGGNIVKVIHSTNYIESPPINTSVPGPVWLEYRRWLNSDYASSSTQYMVNYVEVWNGLAWTVIWQSGASPGIKDAAWTRMSHEVTAYKSPAMKVRFGFRIGSVSVANVSGWNLDEVIVASNVCN
ncbi:hypothetical protein [Chondromyces apiculatus]|uniref:MAM domain-containing protein n=1 Tax=Chondromyces apiculatus DSM 436 TaxID=1192034 RepID=A0A017SY98_9BACT|nr:hypothetical protein [Chondromyces apiculatus]EYF01281.1 Hypothetical protein CAP_8435 [Chondromyces apiculatus DSM 436]